MLFSKFQVIYSGNKSFLIFSPSKDEEINYSQVDMFENSKYREYFLHFECTKNKQVTRISFDITGLTSLSEYIKTSLTQEQYFDIILEIQRIASFCRDASLSFDNLICDPKYIYYHYVSKKLYMAYAPLKNPHCICDDLPVCLNKIHKNAKNIIISDGNYMTRYENYLSRFSSKKGKKSGGQVFSPDSLQHFFNKNEDLIQSNEVQSSETVKTDSQPYVGEYDICSQISNTSFNTSVSNSEHSSSHSYHNSTFEGRNSNEHSASISGNNSAQNYVSSSPTVLGNSENRAVYSSGQSECNGQAYLVSQSGEKVDISCNPFTIGRQEPKSLILNSADISRSHAVILKREDGYYIKNESQSGGTFLNENFSDRINERKLSDGDRIYFYRTCYTFKYDSVPSSSSATIINSGSSLTVISGSSVAVVRERPLAYLRRFSDNSSIQITRYPFTSEIISGVVFYSKVVNNRTVIFVENSSCQYLVFENVKSIGRGERAEIFSGCCLNINGEQYSFSVEN